jgi:hypothetical protein
MNLREQMKNIGPQVQAEDVIAAEPAAKRPLGKLIVGAVLIAVVVAAGFGMFAKQTPSRPDPKDLGATSSAVQPAPKAAPPVESIERAVAGEAVPKAPSAASAALPRSKEGPVPAGNPARTLPGPVSGPSVPSDTTVSATTASATQSEAPKPTAAPTSAAAEAKSVGPAPAPQAKAAPPRKSAPASRATMAAKPAARGSIDHIGITEE